jgi:hypothetical protein
VVHKTIVELESGRQRIADMRQLDVLRSSNSISAQIAIKRSKKGKAESEVKSKREAHTRKEAMNTRYQ